MRMIFVVLLSLLAAGPALAAVQLPNGTQDPEAIPGVVVSNGTRDIAKAWLIAPTARYPHFVRGQEYEPSGLRVVSAKGRVITLMLGENFVFEDRIARLADLDGDGRDEIIVVLTSSERGSALAAYALEGGQLVLKARTPFIGMAFRWLNPAGIADYDGDGQLDVALVQKPHLSKQFEIWTIENGTFVRFASVPDISNHRNGAPETGLSASADFDGDGIDDIAVLSGDYSTLRILGFTSRQSREIARYPLPAQATGDFLLTRLAGGWQLKIPLSGGEIFEVNISE